MWSGLGITAGQPYGSWFEFNTDTHAAIAAPFLPQITRFPRIRALREQVSDTSKAATRLWMQDVKAHKPTTYCLYGITNSGSVYLPSLYASYLVKLLDDAQWAQENGMDAFCVGNEFESSSQRAGASSFVTISSLDRLSNVVTAVTATPHFLSTGDTIQTTGATPSNMNVDQVACTVLDATTLTYPAAGTDGSATGTLRLYAGVDTIIRLVKLLAVQARTVYTSGSLIYSFAQGYENYYSAATITPGTDLDFFGHNIYGADFAEFMSKINTMWAAQENKLIITEFNLNAVWSSARARGIAPNQRGFDPLYADDLYKRMKFIQTKGIPQAYMFSCWNASASENNAFTIWYNTNPVTGNGGALLGNWKSAYDRLLERRISKVFLGTQEHT